MTGPDERRAGIGAHLLPCAFFAGLALLWTWPLALHLTTAIPGKPGDNYSFLWALWWMRRALSAAGTGFFHTDYLFFPFGTSLVNQSHTALPAFVAATVLGPLSIVTAQNLLLLGYVFLNGAVTYLLAWDVVRHRRAAIVAGVLFATSPYLAARLLGHYELMALWVFPAFVWAFRRALERRSAWFAALSGTVLVVTAYTAYYYVVYLGLFALVYYAAWAGSVSVTAERAQVGPARATFRRVLFIVLLITAALAVAVAVTGGTELRAGFVRVSLRRPQNLLTATWLLLAGWWLLGRRVRVRVASRDARVKRTLAIGPIVVLVFVAGAFPLLRDGVALMRTGDYVSVPYFWRSAPKGVDAVAPLVGHPYHPLTGYVSRRLYRAVESDPVEAVAWLGVIPLLLLFGLRVTPSCREEARRWWAVSIVFAIWALGPMLRVGGFDVGLWLPEVLARYVPFVENARMPGRAITGVYLALAMLIAMRWPSLGARWQRPSMQWLLVGLLVFEFADMPVPLTTLDRPAVVERLASEPPGAVCNVPFSVGDGLQRFGPSDLSMLWEATLHDHPVVGGSVSRMPKGTIERYAAMPVVGTLLRLSAPGVVPDGPAAAPTAQSPCAYLVVKRAALTNAMDAYLKAGPFELVAGDADRQLYRVKLSSR
ncbi:MAG: hypothetical protein ACM3NQ_07740 [Bacteroidales bacterium]